MNTSLGSDLERSEALSQGSGGRLDHTSTSRTKDSRSNSYSRSKDIDIQMITKTLGNRQRNPSQAVKRDNKKNKEKRDNPRVEIDANDANLKQFYWSISTKTKLDPEKLQPMVKQHFQDQSEFVYAIIKKVFCNFK